ncbi:hypothetical protein CBR_g19725 [Chara braunii]|uniref:DNA damage-binding protein 1 n=1 Tax=Chara braunii TaxID=69332 RepID=A0A388JU08_CHABU|nr:hypothetical protein CBR_g19725 [Chara braunii]|eukprot:GBG61192.1 hypothetical protein CBR_g19725 [Chara braunii]
MSIWNYVVTAHKPTAVTHSAVGNFTSPSELNLIVAKCTRIEIHQLSPQGLTPMLDVPIYGRIATMELFRPPGETKDVLFLSTERFKFCVLEYDLETKELNTRAMGDVSDKIGRPTDTGHIGIVDPDCRMIGLHLYEGLFKVIPIDSKGQLKEAFNIRLEELQVIDIKFLYGYAKPTIAVLYQDSKDARHLKTYEVLLKDKDFTDGPWMQPNVESGAGMIIPVPTPLGGVIIVGEQLIMYHDGTSFKTIPIRPSVTKAYGRVDADGSRYLLSDQNNLHLLVLDHDKERVLGLKIEPLGETSCASTISYLDNGVVFIGSCFGDSQLVKLNSQPDPRGSYVEVLENFVNLGPIVDICVVDLERQGQGQVITCSGAAKDGSLRIVRNGIGINEQATVDVPGIKGMWSLRASSMDVYDTFLVVTFISETRILAMNAEEELDETEIEGFDAATQTLYCGNVIYDQIVQITSSSVRLVDVATRQAVTQWNAPPNFSINVATANATQVLLATGGGNLVYLEIGEGELRQVNHLKLEYEISCLDINPIPEDAGRSALAAVGMWTDISLRVYSLPSLTLLAKENLGGETIPRSVLFCAFEGSSSGVRRMERLDGDDGSAPEGSRVMMMTAWQGDDNDGEDDHGRATMAGKQRTGAGVLAIAKEGELTIGTIDDIQKLHIRTVPLGEQARRIAHQEQSRTFAILTVKPVNWEEEHHVRMLDDQTFETVASFPLDLYENGTSIISCQFSDDTNAYYVVGTAYVLPEESEPTKGRILVFTVEDQKLQLVTEKETKGAVYNLNAFNGKLLAGINQKVQLYKWVQREDGTRELVSECGHHGHIIALYVKTRGDFIVVGDLMKSISLLIYKPEEGDIEERAHDYNANWMTAVEILDDDIYLGAENSFNLFTVRKNSDAASDEERGRLELVGDYHLGEFVNPIRHGSLVMRLPDSEASQIPTVIFGTVNGVIGVIASLQQEQFAFLHKLQKCLTKVIKGVGGFSHDQWRSFCNERRTTDAKNFLDGDLIEAFLDLKRHRMDEVSRMMDVPVEELCKRVEEMTRLH